MTQPHDNIAYLTSLVQIFSTMRPDDICGIVRANAGCTNVCCPQCPFNSFSNLGTHAQFLNNLIPVATATGLIIGETNVSENSK